MIRLINKYRDKPTPGAMVVSIMRPSVLSNPFKNGTRDEMCDAFGAYAVNQYLTPGSPFRREIERLAKVGGCIDLLCCCAPLRCHGETVRNLIETCRMGL